MAAATTPGACREYEAIGRSRTLNPRSALLEPAPPRSTARSDPSRMDGVKPALFQRAMPPELSRTVPPCRRTAQYGREDQSGRIRRRAYRALGGLSQRACGHSRPRQPPKSRCQPGEARGGRAALLIPYPPMLSRKPRAIDLTAACRARHKVAGISDTVRIVVSSMNEAVSMLRKKPFLRLGKPLTCSMTRWLNGRNVRDDGAIASAPEIAARRRS